MSNGSPLLLLIVGLLGIVGNCQPCHYCYGAAGVETNASPLQRLQVPASLLSSHLGHELGIQFATIIPSPNRSDRNGARPGDPLWEEQWGLARIQAPAAWEAITGTQEVVIADIGSGLDTSHPDLAGQLWVNPGEIPGNGLDDDNNGHIDDIHGWNVLADDADLSDSTGHSTAVAGIIAAARNEEGVTGVCWRCRLMVVKVTSPEGLADYSDIVQGINYAAQNGAHVINISLRGHLDRAGLRSAIAAASQTAVVVSGAGNDQGDTPVYPGAYDTVLAVASTNQDDERQEESNHGPWVDVSAPGRGILTTAKGGGYEARSGTSMACAFASGLAGLLRRQHPEWSPDAVRAHIKSTTDDIDDLNPGLEGQLGTGRINACRAIREAARPRVDSADNGEDAAG